MSSRRPRRPAIAEPTGDLALVRLYWPLELRPAFDALMAIDAAMAEVVATSTQPALGAIRLAWWREALERLDTADPPPEPRLQAAAAELLPRDVSGAMLSAIEDGYAAMIEERPDSDRVAAGGAALFACGMALLDATDPKSESAGRLFGLARAMRAGSMALPEDVSIGELAGHRFARAIRPLTALARLAARDIRQAPTIEPEATPGRAVALLSHKLFGTVA